MTTFTGEGSKRAFLAICDLLQDIECQIESSSRQEMVMMISGAQSTLEEEGKEYMKDENKADRSLNLEAQKVSAKTCIKRSLAARVHKPIAKYLTDLLCQFLEVHLNNCTPGDSFLHNMDTFINTLASQVVEVYNKSVFESSIGEGSFINNSLSITSEKLNFSKQKIARNIRFIFLAVEKHAVSQVTLNLTRGDSKGLGSVSSSVWRKTGEVVDILNEAKIELVIAPGALPLSLRQRLKGAGIAAIEHAGFEEIRSISQAVQVIPWCSNDYELGQVNIGCAKIVQSTVLGGEHSVRIVTSARSHHLLLAAPSKHLARQFSQGMLAAARSARLAATGKHGDHDGLELLGKRHNCEVLSLLGKCFSSWREKQRCAKESEGELFESTGLAWQIALCAVNTVKTLYKIEKICPTRKRISAVVKKCDRVGEVDTDSDDE